jgi:hypothetical protein
LPSLISALSLADLGLAESAAPAPSQGRTDSGPALADGDASGRAAAWAAARGASFSLDDLMCGCAGLDAAAAAAALEYWTATGAVRRLTYERLDEVKARAS